MELAKQITTSMERILTLDALNNSSCRWRGMEWEIAQGKMVRTETAVTMNNVTDSFLSMLIEPWFCE